MRFRPWFLIPTALYLWLVASITLGAAPYGTSGAGLLSRVLATTESHTATAWITFTVLERLSNVALFVPLGFLGAVTFPRRLWAIPFVLAVLLSCGIEAFQGAYLPTRVEDFHDVVDNGLGALLGALSVTIVRMLVATRPTSRRRAGGRAAHPRLASPVPTRSVATVSAKLDRLPSNGRG